MTPPLCAPLLFHSGFESVSGSNRGKGLLQMAPSQPKGDTGLTACKAEGVSGNECVERSLFLWVLVSTVGSFLHQLGVVFASGQVWKSVAKTK